MAGTRLIVHLAFLVPFVVLLVLAVSNLCSKNESSSSSGDGGGGGEGEEKLLICRRVASFFQQEILHRVLPPSQSTTTNADEGSNNNNVTTTTSKIIEYDPVVITCDENQVVFWQSALYKSMKKKLREGSGRDPAATNIVVSPDSNDNLERICNNGKEEGEGDAVLVSSDVWICPPPSSSSSTAESSPSPSKIRVHKNGRIVLYPSTRTTNEEAAGLLDRMLLLSVPSSTPTSSSCGGEMNKNLYIRLWVSDDNDDDEGQKNNWKHGMNALNSHMEHNRYKGIAYNNWPCLLRRKPPVVLQLRTTTMMMDYEEEEAKTTAPSSSRSRIIDIAAAKTAATGGGHSNKNDLLMKQLLSSSSTDSMNTLDDNNANFYVNLIWNPNPKVPIRFVDSSSHSEQSSSSSNEEGEGATKGGTTTTSTTSNTIQLGTNTIVTVINNEQNQTIDSLLTSIMKRVWSRWCMGIHQNFDELDNDGDDGTFIFPSLMWKLWHQRTIQEMYETVQSQLEHYESHKRQLESTFWSLPYEDHDSDWKEDVYKYVQLASDSARSGQYEISLRHMQTAQDLITKAKQNNVYHPHLIIDMPVEQYLAIFAPLIFPLLLPLLIGLIREIKRYKQLTKAKKEKTQP